MADKKATSYQLVDHGVDGAQYFPGHGTAYTHWEGSATGAGDNIGEAVDDALETLAQDGWDVSQIEPLIQKEIEGAREVSATEIAAQYIADEMEDEDVIKEAGLDENATEEQIAEAALELAKESDDIAGSELYYYVSIDVSSGDDEDATPAEQGEQSED